MTTREERIETVAGEMLPSVIAEKGRLGLRDDNAVIDFALLLAEKVVDRVEAKAAAPKEAVRMVPLELLMRIIPYLERDEPLWKKVKGICENKNGS